MELTKTSLLDLVNKVGGAYYKLEDTSDSSGNAHTLTNNGSVVFDAGLFNNAADFGASNTTKSLTIASNLGITGDVITISGWVKLNTEITSGSYFLFQQQDVTSKIAFYIRYIFNAGTPQLDFIRDFNASADQVTFNITLGTTNWYHIAMTYDGTNIRGYINGVLVGVQASSTAGSGTAAASAASIGASTTPSLYSSAKIDDALFLHQALTPQQIAEIYNTDATALGLANTNSLRFYNTYSQYVTVTPVANLEPTGAFTIESWVKTSTTGAFQVIFHSGAGGATSNGIQLYIDNSQALTAVIGYNNGSQMAIQIAITNDGQWHHAAFTYDGTNGRLYWDGILIGGPTAANNAVYPAGTHVTIGGQWGGSVYQSFMDGYLNDVRLFNGTAKTQAQIQADMGNSTLLFTTNLTSRWTLNSSSGTTATDSVGANNGTLTGYTSGFEGWSGDVPYSGNSINYASLALVSTNSEIVKITDASNLKPTSAWTIEAWIKTLGTVGTIFQSLSVNPNVAGIKMDMGNPTSGKMSVYSGKNTGLTLGTDYQRAEGATAVNDGTWHHIAVTYDGVHLTVYVDGVQDGQTAWANNPAYAATNYVQIGAENDSGSPLFYFNGKIENVRLWSVARSAAQLLANKSVSVIGTSGLISEWRTQNQGLDQTALVSGGNSSANNISTYTNNPVFITDVPFASYLTTISISDTGSGVDAIDVTNPIDLSETASGIDAITVGPNSIPIADTGSGLDAVTVGPNLIPISDSGSGADVVTSPNLINLSESGVGLDDFSILGLIPLADIASGADALSIMNSFTIADTASGADVVAILEIIFKSGIHPFNKSIGFTPTYSPRNNTFSKNYRSQTY